MRTHKIRLKLTKDQEQLAWSYSRVARRYWNLLVDVDRRNSKGEFDDFFSTNGNKTYYSSYYERDVYSLKEKDYRYLCRRIALEGYETIPDDWSWFFQPNLSFIQNSLIRDFLQIRFRNKGKMRFRSVATTTPSFPIRCDMSSDKKRLSRVYLKKENHLQIPTLGSVKFGSTRKGFDLNCKKQTAQVNFDGKYWYLVYTEAIEDTVDIASFTEGIGVDLGLTNLATISNGKVVPSSKTFRRVGILERRLKRKQRKVSRKYLINKCNKHNKTKNIIKLEREIKLIHRTLKNIRLNHIREFVASLVKEAPMYIALEDLDVRKMMKDKHLAKSIANASFYTVRQEVIRKATKYNIVVRLVDRFYPSSKTCSSCGYVKDYLPLSERVYNCESCNLSLDRDLNASYNLASTDKYILA